ncbi:MAG: chitobiase/beta-hexosaminidase C-terminal domain-containing protein, partial [Lachnospiraceae bacterium]|nr:chitobiase/beta-hexosaminidase C-terminal domain-containing protein [Lachnospiraceae bacterium]
AVTVKQGETTLAEGTDYDITYSATDFTNAGTITVTITGKGNYTGTVKKTYTITKAAPTIAWNKASQELTYTGNPAVIAAPTVTLVNGETFGGTINYSYAVGNAASYTSGLPTDAGTYTIKASIAEQGNYAAAESTNTLTISYMNPPGNILYNGAAKADYYGRKEVVISADDYTVSDVQNGEYKASFTIPVPAQTGTVAKTLYFSKGGGISDGVVISVNFDLTPPAGKVKIGTRWWETLLNAITFGHYAAKDYTVTIESNDTGGSGIAGTEYAVIEGDTQYTDADALAKAAGINWKEYDSGNKPTVPVESKCVIYARLMDHAGNVSYISTDGILLDKTSPVVDGLSIGTVEARTAGFTFTVDEAADYYYVVLPESASAPGAADMIAAVTGGAAITGSAASGTGEVKEGQVTGGKAAVNVAVSGLTPGMAYKVYVTAVDKTVDLETGAPAGNVGAVTGSAGFTMKKLDQEAPALTYTRNKETGTEKITLVIGEVAGAEYSFDGGLTWTDSREQAGFDASQTVTLAIRMKETATHYASPVQTVTVNFAKEDKDAPGAFKLLCEPNGETDYTVTIPSTEGCEYSFDGITWSDNNVKTGVKAGETVTGYKRYKETDDTNASSAVSDTETMQKFTVKTPVISPASGSFTGNVSVTITCGSADAEIYYTTDGSTPSGSSTRYTGAFTVTPPVTVKAAAIKEGLTDSAVAEVSYTKQGSGGGGGSGSSGGGNSGGSGSSGNSGDGNNGGNGSGSGNGNNNDGNGNGNTEQETPDALHTDTPSTEPDAGTTSVKPGNGEGTGAGNHTAQDNTPQSGREPFIKGADGKIGWDVIRSEEEKAENGNVINVDMNGSAVVPGDIFDRLKGRDITITFDMGNGIVWIVDGKSITTDKADDIDFSVKTGVNAVPVDIVNNITGARYSIQLSLAHEGEFGFTAVLSINIGEENAGLTASLYYYNESTGELEFISSGEVAEDGTVSLAFTHASDYVIVIDGDEEESGITEPAQPEGTEGTDGDRTAGEESPQTGHPWRAWWFVVIGVLVVIIGAGVFFVVKKKEGED